jgi:hypothetical protein
MMFSFFKHLFPSKKKTLRRLAKNTGGVYQKRKIVRTGKVVWDYKGFIIELEYVNRNVGYYLVGGTRLSFIYTPRVEYDFILHPKSLVDDLSEWLGVEHNIKLNDKDFDEHYIIQANDDQITKRLFSDISIQYLIECFPDITVRTYNKNIIRRKLPPNHKFVLLNYPKLILNEKQIESFFMLSKKVVDRMEKNYLV